MQDVVIIIYCLLRLLSFKRCRIHGLDSRYGVSVGCSELWELKILVLATEILKLEYITRLSCTSILVFYLV
jgi:hypothetical protein